MNKKFTKKTIFVFFLSSFSFSYASNIVAFIDIDTLLNNSNSEYSDETSDESSLTGGEYVDFKEIKSGWSHNFALDENNKLWGIGYNKSGNLGDGTSENKDYWIKLDFENIKQFETGGDNSIVLLNNGELYVAGKNNSGSLGVGTTNYVTNWTKITSTNFTSVDEILSVSDSNTFIRSGNKVYGTGYNVHGGLGDGTGINKSEFFEIPFLENVSYMTTGWWNSFAIKNGKLYSTGTNYNSQLGYETTETCHGNPCSLEWKEAEGIQGTVTDVFVNDSTIFYQNSNGDVYGRGYNEFGQVGVLPNAIDSDNDGFPDFIEIGEGTDENNNSDFPSCNLIYGDNNECDSLYEVDSWVLLPYKNVKNIVSNYHTIVHKSDNTVDVVGYNEYRQLGTDGDSEVWGESVALDWINTGFTADNVTIGWSDSIIQVGNDFYVTGENWVGGLGLGYSGIVSEWTKMPTLKEEAEYIVEESTVSGSWLTFEIEIPENAVAISIETNSDNDNNDTLLYINETMTPVSNSSADTICDHDRSNSSDEFCKIYVTDGAGTYTVGVKAYDNSSFTDVNVITKFYID